MKVKDDFDVLGHIGDHAFVDLRRLPDQAAIAELPVWRKLLLEGLLRNFGRFGITEELVRNATRSGWRKQSETVFCPTRIVMQDYSGTAVLTDLAGLRSVLAEKGIDPELASPQVPVDLVIDHSLVLEHTGPGSLARNLVDELAGNAERYAFLRWAEENIDGVTLVPPGQGIIHQLNMERFAQPVILRDGWLMPDTVIGTDSHTTMINGLGILGWGVGGIEATAAMMGMPMSMLIPRSVGLRITGTKRPGVQAADIALALTERLRAHGVVGSVIEVFGPGVAALTVEDRATISNMCPEYGATACVFPMDDAVFAYFRSHGRPSGQIELGRKLAARNGFALTSEQDIKYDDRLEFDLSSCGMSVAGPTRPDQRHDLSNIGSAFAQMISASNTGAGRLKDGDIVLAAITSCTNTANPRAMIAAGLLARVARKHGYRARRGIKCTMALGSTRAAEGLRQLGLLDDLEAVGFFVDGFGCGACVGNVGRFEDGLESDLNSTDATVVAVLSGNRNFPGRIHPKIRANFLSSPAAVVALALLGHVRSDPFEEPLGVGQDGSNLTIGAIWPRDEEVEVLAATLDAMPSRYPPSSAAWTEGPTRKSATFPWHADSNYFIRPPFLDMSAPGPSEFILSEAVPLVMLGDAITTDHISPVGRIEPTSDAGRYLSEMGVSVSDYNTYGSRRGNHEVMLRGTFANPRIQNKLVDCLGPWTKVSTSAGRQSIFEAAMRLAEDERQSLVIAGKFYGAGSARDWAAKGTRLLGVRAVIAESFERIHRSNLISMGVVPLQVQSSDAFPICPDLRVSAPITWGSLRPNSTVELEWKCAGMGRGFVKARLGIDSETELSIVRKGGILGAILKQLISNDNSVD